MKKKYVYIVAKINDSEISKLQFIEAYNYIEAQDEYNHLNETHKAWALASRPLEGGECHVIDDKNTTLDMIESLKNYQAIQYEDHR